MSPCHRLACVGAADSRWLKALAQGGRQAEQHVRVPRNASRRAQKWARARWKTLGADLVSASLPHSLFVRLVGRLLRPYLL